jgi:hypothetical protein
MPRPSLTCPHNLLSDARRPQEDSVAPYLLIYHFFGLLWTAQFITGVGSMTIAGAVCAWYFSQNESKSPEVSAATEEKGGLRVVAGSEGRVGPLKRMLLGGLVDTQDTAYTSRGERAADLRS